MHLECFQTQKKKKININEKELLAIIQGCHKFYYFLLPKNLSYDRIILKKEHLLKLILNIYLKIND